MAHVTVVANQKGGVGKTTVSINLGAVVHNVLAGGTDTSPVLVASTDPQASAVWWSQRVERLPFDFVEASNPRDLARLKNQHRYQRVFVDSPGSLEDEAILLATLEHADDVLVPMPPEGLAYDPTARTIERVIKPRGLRYWVVINNWDPRDGRGDLGQTQAYIDKRGWPRTNVVIRRYKIHTRAAVDGLVVTEYPKNRVAMEAREDFFRLALELGLGAAVGGAGHHVEELPVPEPRGA